MKSKSHGNQNLNLISHAKAGDARAVASLLALGVNPRGRESAALFEAAENGHADCVEILIPVSDPMAVNSRALRHAARAGHAAVVQLLMAVSDAKADHSRALAWAAQEGRVECLRLLIPASDPAAEDFRALRFAASGGHAECVELLIPFSHEGAEAIGESLVSAAYYGHAECAKALMRSPASLSATPRALYMAMDIGHASVVAAMIAHDPSLAGRIRHSHRKAAVRANKTELAELLCSILEQQAIDESLPASASPSPSRARL